MKKNLLLRSLCVFLMLVTLMAFAGCGDNGGGEVIIGGGETTGGENNATESFAFVHNNVKITPNDLVAPLVTALGSDYTYRESPSCAFIGMDKQYIYKGFTIYTYPDDKGVDHVLYVLLTDDTVSTPEGVIIGDTVQKVVSTYGENYVDNGASYTYTKGKTLLQFLVKDGIVEAIQFAYKDAM